MLLTTNPRTGTTSPSGAETTDPREVAEFAHAAELIAPQLRSRGREFRADLLDAMAAAVESSRAELVQTADLETALGEARLNGEVSRSAFQFALFASAIREGGYLEAMIDHASDTPLGPAPDVRRMLVPLGPVAVFGSSNFPFAFSVLGGDTASAIAAGCPVVVKAHSSHIRTSKLSFDVLQRAAAEVGAPRGTFAAVYGQSAGTMLVTQPGIKAASFTGSLNAAEALMSAIETRSDPIPFYGELSSINPLVVTAGAAKVRGAEIAQGLFGSVTGSGGQLCTKPGIAFIPEGVSGQLLVDELGALIRTAQRPVLLNRRISDAYGEISERLIVAGGELRATSETELADSSGFDVSPAMLEIPATALDARLAEECFGPLVIVARYSDVSEVSEAITRIPRSLTATVHVEPDEVELVGELLSVLEASAGRLVFNGYPTGVRVTWAQNHGGPWPATNTQHTSVGITAIRRFLRPFAWQNAPQSVLPPELRDERVGIPRRVDGVLHTI